jgi:ABC-2 type transport system ATP-binding protein
VNRKLLRELIDEQHTAGRTIIFSTHAMFEAEALCDQIFMIHQGKKVLDGSLADILKQHDPRSMIVELIDPADVEVLRALPQIQSVVSGALKGKSANAVQVMLEDGTDVRQAMARIAAAIPVNRLERRRAELEDIFMRLVLQGGEADETLMASLSARSSSLEGGE